MQIILNKRTQIILIGLNILVSLTTIFLSKRMTFSDDTYILLFLNTFFVTITLGSLVTLFFRKEVLFYWIKSTLILFIPVSLLLIFLGKNFLVSENQLHQYFMSVPVGIYYILTTIYLYFKNKKIKLALAKGEIIPDLKTLLLNSNSIFFLLSFVITSSVFIQVNFVKEFDW